MIPKFLRGIDHFCDLPGHQIYGFHYRIVRREGQFVLGVLSDFPVQILMRSWLMVSFK